MRHVTNHRYGVTSVKVYGVRTYLVIDAVPGLGTDFKNVSGPRVHLGRKPDVFWFPNNNWRPQTNSKGISLFVSFPAPNQSFVVNSRWQVIFRRSLVLCYRPVVLSTSRHKIKVTSNIQERSTILRCPVVNSGLWFIISRLCWFFVDVFDLLHWQKSLHVRSHISVFLSLSSSFILW